MTWVEYNEKKAELRSEYMVRLRQFPSINDDYKKCFEEYSAKLTELLKMVNRLK